MSAPPSLLPELHVMCRRPFTHDRLPFSDYFTEPDKANKIYQLMFAEGMAMDYRLIIRHTNGTATEVLYNASVYRDANGKVLGAFAAAAT